ncbi:SMP-30/gluconolactonase/LRE family protein [Qipengyuania flava]|uniref:SMP-30/gluconolactonase/LRE family protein n=1 Tax=Qipengyuania flava TaxID=192812 RepID=UPI001C636668|nr:SMP-30/gluconolactonase/LRE family protein [Qipengyuania flava]QYJ07745.1 SMP-30/gluconolactonase/LRE family protein [Qipengyuania flava]
MQAIVTRRSILAGGTGALLAGCMGSHGNRQAQALNPIGFERFTPDFDARIDTSQAGRLLASGYQWAEGPAWDARRQTLYFTDVPANRAYRWSETGGASVFLDPSGAQEAAEGFREPGANGLLLSRDGRLTICNHGERAVQAMDLTTGRRETLASRFEGKRFNSPNDVIEAADGTLFFTDPPYGLAGLDASPLKEMAANGVYRLSPDGTLSRIVEDMTFPNGVALSLDEKALFISQSDPSASIVRKLDLRAGARPHTWFDATPYRQGHAGLPDGMAMAANGDLFLAGPGGVLVIDREGVCHGRIATGRATANCAFGEDGHTLFITAQDRLLAVRTKVSASRTASA